MKINTSVKSLEMLLGTISNNDTRLYAMVVYVDREKNMLVASDSMTLISHLCEISGDDVREEVKEGEKEGRILTMLSYDYVKKVIAIAKLDKQEYVDLEPTIKDFVPGQYPPYVAGKPAKPEVMATYDIAMLEKILKNLKKSGNKKVIISAEYVSGTLNFRRPLLLECSSETWGIVVPCQS